MIGRTERSISRPIEKYMIGRTEWSIPRPIEKLKFLFIIQYLTLNKYKIKFIYSKLLFQPIT
jgi:hypothetical protein